MKKLQEKVAAGTQCFALEADEIDDPRPANAYIVTVDIYMLPKVRAAEDPVDVQKYHIKLDFPTAVNNETLANCIDEVCWGMCQYFISVCMLLGPQISPYYAQGRAVFCAR